MLDLNLVFGDFLEFFHREVFHFTFVSRLVVGFLTFSLLLWYLIQFDTIRLFCCDIHESKDSSKYFKYLGILFNVNIIVVSPTDNQKNILS